MASVPYPAFGEAAIPSGGDASSQPYCGIYCLYGASIRTGVELPFQELLQPKYVTSRDGSSLRDLERAAHDHGLKTLSFGNGTLGLLRALKDPVILHVTADVSSRRYTHYVLLVESPDEGFVLLDPGRRLRVVTPAELVAIWDRAGLIVSAKRIDAKRLLFCALLPFILWTVSILIVVLLIRRVISRSELLSGSRTGDRGLSPFYQSIIILVLTGSTAIVYQSVVTAGLIRQSTYVSKVERNHVGSFLPRLSLMELESHTKNGSLLIDARYANDYISGHIDGAVNMPVNSNSFARTAVLSRIQKDREMIIYCQSRGCPFSESLAKNLLDDGYTNIELVDGGFNEWTELRKAPRE